jgi:hypothetical protein
LPATPSSASAARVENVPERVGKIAGCRPADRRLRSPHGRAYGRHRRVAEQSSASTERSAHRPSRRRPRPSRSPPRPKSWHAPPARSNSSSRDSPSTDRNTRGAADLPALSASDRRDVVELPELRWRGCPAPWATGSTRPCATRGPPVSSQSAGGDGRRQRYRALSPAGEIPPRVRSAPIEAPSPPTTSMASSFTSVAYARLCRRRFWPPSSTGATQCHPGPGWAARQKARKPTIPGTPSEACDATRARHLCVSVSASIAEPGN